MVKAADDMTDHVRLTPLFRHDGIQNPLLHRKQLLRPPVGSLIVVAPLGCGEKLLPECGIGKTTYSIDNRNELISFECRNCSCEWIVRKRKNK